MEGFELAEDLKWHSSHAAACKLQAHKQHLPMKSQGAKPRSVLTCVGNASDSSVACTATGGVLPNCRPTGLPPGFRPSAVDAGQPGEAKSPPKGVVGQQGAGHAQAKLQGWEKQNQSDEGSSSLKQVHLTSRVS